MCTLWFRSREIERGAFIHEALGPDLAAMPVNDALHRGKPDSGTLEGIRLVQALEDAKKFVNEIGRASCRERVLRLV